MLEQTLEGNNLDIQKLLAGIKIPPCPAILLEVMKEIKRPDADIDRIAKPITRDAGIAALILKLANSAIFSRGRKITSIHQAMTLLGTQTTTNLLNQVSLLQCMPNKSINLNKFWDRSSQTATVSAWLAGKLSGISTDDAYISGLFHDCGIPVLMGTFPNYRDVLIANANMGQDVHQVENKYFSTDHAVVGSMMARSWYLPDNVTQAIRYHHDKTIFSNDQSDINKESLGLISILYMAEMILDESICQKNPEWNNAESDVLNYMDLSQQDWSELKGDALSWMGTA